MVSYLSPFAWHLGQPWKFKISNLNLQFSTPIRYHNLENFLRIFTVSVVLTCDKQTSCQKVLFTPLWNLFEIIIVVQVFNLKNLFSNFFLLNIRPCGTTIKPPKIHKLTILVLSFSAPFDLEHGTTMNG